MNRETMKKLDKGVFVLLILLAAVAILIAMVAGPLGRDTLSIGAAASAVVICIVLLLYLLGASRRK